MYRSTGQNSFIVKGCFYLSGSEMQEESEFQERTETSRLYISEKFKRWFVFHLWLFKKIFKTKYYFNFSSCKLMYSSVKKKKTYKLKAKMMQNCFSEGHRAGFCTFFAWSLHVFHAAVWVFFPCFGFDSVPETCKLFFHWTFLRSMTALKVFQKKFS